MNNKLGSQIAPQKNLYVLNIILDQHHHSLGLDQLS